MGHFEALWGIGEVSDQYQRLLPTPQASVRFVFWLDSIVGSVVPEGKPYGEWRIVGWEPLSALVADESFEALSTAIRKASG
ncbi:MAG: hypothetical protein GY768_13125 [Planctomycetaceae bacterium]|nr:hypothetical protein [Planctomycetaceae bacterium]